jgi:hypothetical protein
MLEASGQVGYLNEPFNLAMSPGTFRIPVDHWYTHITDENEARVLAALRDALAFQDPFARELSRCRSRADIHRTLKGWRTFLRHRNRRAVIKEPHAVFSAAWFARRLSSNIVITVRHPAAVVSSWKRLGWDFDFMNLLEQPLLMRDWLESFRPDMEAAMSPRKGLVDRIALLWSIIHSVVNQYQQRFPQFRIILQEDLSCDPAGQFAGLYESVGLSFTKDAISAVARSSSTDNPEETQLANPHQTLLDSRATLESWKGRLTEEEIGRIRRVTEVVTSAFYPETVWQRRKALAPASGVRALEGTPQTTNQSSDIAAPGFPNRHPH